jgi:hypothetical protein
MKLLRTLALGLLLVLSLPATARAHDSVFPLKYVDGNNIVVANYNVHDFTVDQRITFNLRVYTIAGSPVAYKSVQAVVKQDDKVVFDRTMAASNDSDVNWLYAFPNAGDYDVALRFTNHDARVARADFPIDVGGHAGDEHAHSLVSQIVAWPTLAALLLGIGLTLGAQRVRRRSVG